MIELGGQLRYYIEIETKVNSRNSIGNITDHQDVLFFNFMYVLITYLFCFCPSGCVGASPCGLAAPYSPPALPIPPPPAPVAYGGFPPAPVPYGPQRFAQPPAMGTDGFGMHSINSLAQGAAEAKIKLLAGIHPPKKFVPHIPPMGRPQPGKPAYIPPPPLPKPQAAGYAQAGHLPYQKPFGYGQQGMAPPQAPGFVPQPQGMVPPQTPGFAPQPAAAIPQPGVPPMQADFADPQAFTVECRPAYVPFVQPSTEDGP